MSDYYVYAYLREDRYTPYYIGKGRGNRLYSPTRTSKRPDDRSRIVKVKEGLTEEESYKLEEALIKFWGRKIDGGLLYNFSEGGGGPKGVSIPRTEEWKQKISAAMKGKSKSEAHKKRISERCKGRKACHTTPHSQETKDKISKKNKGRKLSAETRLRMSEGQKRRQEKLRNDKGT